MSKIAQRFLAIAVGLALGFTITVVMNLPRASAAQVPAPTASRLGATATPSSVELSPSQDAKCKRAPQSEPAHAECNTARHVLVLMSAERRDERWADSMESFLSRWVESLASEGMAPRDIQCRLSWCIVELESTGDRLITLPSNKEKIFSFETMFAPDIDDPNKQDILVLFKRYCKSHKELFDGNNNGHLAPDFDTVGTTC